MSLAEGHSAVGHRNPSAGERAGVCLGLSAPKVKSRVHDGSSQLQGLLRLRSCLQLFAGEDVDPPAEETSLSSPAAAVATTEILAAGYAELPGSSNQKAANRARTTPARLVSLPLRAGKFLPK